MVAVFIVSKFDTSTLSPCFDHIYKSYHYSPPRSNRIQLIQTTFMNSTHNTIFSPSKNTSLNPLNSPNKTQNLNPQWQNDSSMSLQIKQVKHQVLKPSYSLLLKHISHYS